MRVILLPGNGGSTTQDNWFPYIKTHLTEAGINVLDPTCPDLELGFKSTWFPFLNERSTGQDPVALCAV